MVMTKKPKGSPPIAEIELTEDAASVMFYNLAVNGTVKYFLEMSIKDTENASEPIVLFINGDRAQGNYGSSCLGMGQVSFPYVHFAHFAHTGHYEIVTLSLDHTGKCHYMFHNSTQADAYFHYNDVGSGSTLNPVSGGVIDSIELAAQYGSIVFKAGSRFRLFKEVD